MSGNALTQVAVASNRARVVQSGSHIVLAHVIGTSLGDELLETVAAGCSRGAIFDHLGDLAGRARVLDVAVVARSTAVVALHQTRIDHAVVGGWCAHAAVTLLHNNGENEAGIDAGRVGDGLDGAGDVVHLVVGVVGDVPLSAGGGHDILVCFEHVIKGRHPVAHRRPTVRHLTISTENCVCACRLAQVQRMRVRMTCTMTRMKGRNRSPKNECW